MGYEHAGSKDSCPKCGGKVFLVFCVVMGSGHTGAKDSCPKCGGKVLLFF